MLGVAAKMKWVCGVITTLLDPGRIDEAGSASTAQIHPRRLGRRTEFRIHRLLADVGSVLHHAGGQYPARAGTKANAEVAAVCDAAQGQSVVIFDEAAGLAAVKREGVLAAPA